MRKVIFDTSAIISDHTVLSVYSREQMVIPLTVVDELDKGKSLSGDAGWNARAALRYIESEGLHVCTNCETTKESDGDMSIIKCANNHSEESDVTLITEDAGMRVRARAVGLDCSTLNDLQLDAFNNTTLAFVEALSPQFIDVMHGKGHLSLSEMETMPDAEPVLKAMHRSPIWSGVFLKSSCNSALVVWSGQGLTAVKTAKCSAQPRGAKQSIALWALQRPHIPLVTLTGAAGTGKSFIAFSAALDALQSRLYDRVVVVKNFQEVGKGLGYLPGTLEDKLAPWMDSVKDTIRAIYGKQGYDYFAMAIKKGDIEVVPLSFVRGRTFDKSFIIVDEAQNTTPHEIKTVVTRTGRDSKIVLLGDTEQIDITGRSKRSCGLDHVIRRFRDSSMALHCHLTSSQRSDLAGEAGRLL